MFSLLSSEFILLSASTLFVYVLYQSRAKPQKLPLPPGPSKLPFVGNAFSFPSTFEWEAFTQWGKDYNSDILHLSVFGISIVVLNSFEATRDLLEKRSTLYSSRPRFHLITEVMGFEWLIPFMPYGNAWKERRRILQRHFHSQNDALVRPVELKYTRGLLLKLLEDPSTNFRTHVRHAIGSTLMSLTYGTKTHSMSDPIVEVAEETGHHLSQNATPATVLIDKLPFLIPILSPFLSASAFKKPRAFWDKLTLTLRETPFAVVQREMADGTAEPSFVSKALEDISGTQDTAKQHQIIKDVAALVFIGSGTTNAVMQTFFLAMTLFPEAQAKAHEEFDRIIGRGRLPDFDDMPHLPYIAALIREVHRWKTPGPFGIPRILEQDDEYKGYLLPAGSFIMSNAWAIQYNEEQYPNPSTFLPDRFMKDGKLDASLPDPSVVSFGFGRRTCPGMPVANSSVWLMIASLLSVFEIIPPVDEKGVQILPKGNYVSGMTFHPAPFDCVVRPRHKEVEVLIRGTADIHA
ncbi:cytochrome P450 [Crepidotus variabilis]|uniref:Cytochrome P450 n=1 Tax=Crepidotus variabilis TaxID=179855 RepID=A0A9P6JLZ7_9AGAR|nr:cytochrome P450 [Crepidotus variabilis]